MVFSPRPSKLGGAFGPVLFCLMTGNATTYEIPDHQKFLRIIRRDEFLNEYKRYSIRNHSEFTTESFSDLIFQFIAISLPKTVLFSLATFLASVQSEKLPTSRGTQVTSKSIGSNCHNFR